MEDDPREGDLASSFILKNYLFLQSLTLKKMMFYLLLSENGLKSLITMKAHDLMLSISDDTAPLMKIFNEEFPILMTIPPADTKASEKSNAEKLKSLANSLSFKRTLSN